MWFDSKPLGFLLVSHGGAGRTGEVDHIKTLEPGFATPLSEVRAGIVKSIAEFYKHVQRHAQTLNILAARIVNQRLYRYECAARWQGIVGRPD